MRPAHIGRLEVLDAPAMFAIAVAAADPLPPGTAAALKAAREAAFKVDASVYDDGAGLAGNMVTRGDGGDDNAVMDLVSTCDGVPDARGRTADVRGTEAAGIRNGRELHGFAAPQRAAYVLELAHAHYLEDVGAQAIADAGGDDEDDQVGALVCVRGGHRRGGVQGAAAAEAWKNAAGTIPPKEPRSRLDVYRTGFGIAVPTFVARRGRMELEGDPRSLYIELLLLFSVPPPAGGATDVLSDQNALMNVVAHHDAFLRRHHAHLLADIATGAVREGLRLDADATAALGARLSPQPARAEYLFQVCM